MYEKLTSVASAVIKTGKNLNLKKKGYTIEHGSVLEFGNPDPKFQDHLKEIIRSGCQTIIMVALETELQAFLECCREDKDVRDRQRIVRNFHLPERHTRTGKGPVAVRVARTRDRDSNGGIQFTSNIGYHICKKNAALKSCCPGCV